MLEEEDVQLPLTRPNLFMFVPYELGVILGIAFFAVDVQFHSWKLGFLVVPVWLFAAVLTKRDFNGVRVFLTRVRLISTMFDAYRWGGQSVTPMPMKRAAVFRGIKYDNAS